MLKLDTKNFQALLFDMDGVLLDSEPLHFQSFRRIFDPLGIYLPDEYQFKFVGDPLSRNLEDISNDFNIKLELAEFKPKIQAAYLDILEESNMPPNPGVLELLKQGHERDLKTGICTSSPLHQAEIIKNKIETLGDNVPTPAFLEIVSGDMVQHTKPHPEPYLTLCEKLGVLPSNCIAIEDSLSGLAAAKSAGCYTIALKNIYNQNVNFNKIDAAVDSLLDILLV